MLELIQRSCAVHWAVVGVATSQLSDEEGIPKTSTETELIGVEDL